MTPLVLVHGLGVTNRYWSRLRRELGPPTFAPTLPREPRRVDELAQLLSKRLDDAPIDRAHVIANSLGCQIAVELATREPARVASLALVGPTGDPRARTRLRNAWRLLAAGVREPPSLLALVAVEYLVAGPVRVVRQARELVEHPMTGRLRDVHCPALVVRGEHDAICPQRWADEVATLLGDARVVVVRGGAHAVHWSHPRLVARLIQEFEHGVDDSLR